MFNYLLYNYQNNMNYDLSVHNKCQYTNLGIYFIHHLLCTNDYTEDDRNLRNLHKSF